MSNPPSWPKPLKFQVETPKDLPLLSLCLQDAIIPVSTLKYEDGCLLFLAHRFMWEATEEGEDNTVQEDYFRITSGGCIAHVDNLHFQGFNPHDGDDMLSFLTFHQGDEHHLHMVFSGHKDIMVTIHDLSVHMMDVGDPWVTKDRPIHILEEQGPEDTCKKNRP